MSRKIYWFILGCPVLALLVITGLRKYVLGPGGVHVSPQGAIVIPAGPLTKAQEIFNRRQFLGIQDSTQLQQQLQALITPLPLSEKAQAEAMRSCWGIIEAYGTSDWDLFKSIRTPAKEYDVPSRSLTFMSNVLAKIVQDNRETDPVAIYKGIWDQQFGNRPWYTQVSLPTNGVELLDVKLNGLAAVFFADLGVREGQGWGQSSPMVVFDYDQLLSVESNSGKILRLSFFGRTDNGSVSPLMIAFAWDDRDSLWIPCRMTQGIARSGLLQIHFF